MNRPHYIILSSTGEICRMCGKPAYHKVEEVFGIEALEHPTDEQMFKQAMSSYHPYTAYLCCEHFGMVMGANCREDKQNVK